MSSFKAPNRLSHLIHLDSCRRPPTTPIYPSPPSPLPPSSPFSHSCHLQIIGFSLLPSRRFSTRAAGLSSETLMEVIRAALRRSSAAQESVAIRVEQKSYSYIQLISSAWKISNLLCSRGLNSTHSEGRNGISSDSVNGIGGTRFLDGARIGIVAKPSAEFVAGVLGTWLGGGVAVPLALSYPEAELLHVMNDSDVSMLLSTEEHQELMKNVAAKCAAQFSLIPDVPSSTSEIKHDEVGTKGIDLESKLREEFEDSKMAEGDDPALVIYTSGTTGKPKGVVHTHKSIIAQVQILTEAWEYLSSDQFLNCLPLHHIHHSIQLLCN